MAQNFGDYLKCFDEDGREWTASRESINVLKYTLIDQQAIYKSKDVVQVNIPAESGDMGILANHVPSIEQLRPGLVEIIEEAGGSKQFFRKALNCPIPNFG